MELGTVSRFPQDVVRGETVYSRTGKRPRESLRDKTPFGLGGAWENQTVIFTDIFTSDQKTRIKEGRHDPGTRPGYNRLPVTGKSITKERWNF